MCWWVVQKKKCGQLEFSIWIAASLGNSQCIEVVFIIRGNEMALEEPLAEVGVSGILSLKE